MVFIDNQNYMLRKWNCLSECGCGGAQYACACEAEKRQGYGEGTVEAAMHREFPFEV
jgi:hypothetical protein